LLVVVLAIGMLTGCRLVDRIVESRIERQLSRVDTAILESEELNLVLCGTGIPGPDLDRADACTAIIAGGEFVLVDAGPGSWKHIDHANLPGGRLSAIFLTHFHSDHIGGLGEAIEGSWLAGRERPLEVRGPPGTARVVAGFREAYAQNAEYRIAHLGEEIRAGAETVAYEFPLEPENDAFAAAVVLDRNGLRVTMFRVDHGLARPAVGYRFDYRGRAVVVSGDTRKNANVARQARGADILIHEAAHLDLVRRAGKVAERLGQRRLQKVLGDVTLFHTGTLEAAEVARDAGVPTLVFSHLIPGPRNFIERRVFLSGVRDVFPGDAIVGDDEMRFRLPPR
jgi:ribonuclease Z